MEIVGQFHVFLIIVMCFNFGIVCGVSVTKSMTSILFFVNVCFWFSSFFSLTFVSRFLRSYFCFPFVFFLLFGLFFQSLEPHSFWLSPDFHDFWMRDVFIFGNFWHVIVWKYWKLCHKNYFRTIKGKHNEYKENVQLDCMCSDIFWMPSVSFSEIFRLINLMVSTSSSNFSFVKIVFIYFEFFVFLAFLAIFPVCGFVLFSPNLYSSAFLLFF